MATQRTNITTSLKIKVENGTTNTGTVKYATRTFSSINPEISDEDLLAVGQGLGVPGVVGGDLVGGKGQAVHGRSSLYACSYRVNAWALPASTLTTLPVDLAEASEARK